MRRDEVAIYPDARVVIHGAEMQQDAPTARFDREFALVPAGEVKRAIPYAAGRGLWRKRDLDRERPVANIGWMLMTPIVVEQKSPSAVETRPFGALELWTRVGKLQNESSFDGRKRVLGVASSGLRREELKRVAAGRHQRFLSLRAATPPTEHAALL